MKISAIFELLATTFAEPSSNETMNFIVFNKTHNIILGKY